MGGLSGTRRTRVERVAKPAAGGKREKVAPIFRLLGLCGLCTRQLGGGRDKRDPPAKHEEARWNTAATGRLGGTPRPTFPPSVATSATLPQFGFGNNHYNWNQQLEEVRGLTRPRYFAIGRGHVGPRRIKVVSVVVVVSTA